MERWEKQENETPKAFRAFAEYLQLEDRSLAKLVDKLAVEARKRGTKTSPKLRQIKDWSSKYRWVERVAAWEEHLVAESLRALEACQLARRVQLQNDEWDAAQGLLARAQEINRMPLTERVLDETKTSADGKTVTNFYTINPIRATARDAARLLEMYSKLGRLATGLETDRVKIDMEVQAQLEELLGELRTALTPDAFAEIQTYLSARLGERPEERDLN